MNWCFTTQKYGFIAKSQMQHQTIVRTAQNADLDAVAALFDAYRVWYEKPADLSGARTFLEARMLHNESVIFVAETEGVLSGFTQLYPIFSSTRMKRLWLLNDLFVAAEYRGRGISKQLLDRAKQLAAETGACEVMLETQKTNTIGNNLYPSAGFELGTDVNWYHFEL
jgi:ribosomal protein S18 acetylase RimI-like enzyme